MMQATGTPCELFLTLCIVSFSHMLCHGRISNHRRRCQTVCDVASPLAQVPAAQSRWACSVLIATWPSPVLLSLHNFVLHVRKQAVPNAQTSCCVQDFLFHTHKQVSPHLATAKKHGIKTWAQSKKHGWKVWLASKKHTNTFLASPQVPVLHTA